ncbi:hypothetical protein CYMTET_41910 [Cymbomonas tetramitiformis]|uniref:Uncharacterized protein n=1 Tax=Cymbomonas tetramitiformis TaxID=36881 RepID=A0AAE0F1R9_9CHLO|nr:hypothetical protein CYMTET_41910 [Cymbomonas tetramitiformis]
MPSSCRTQQRSGMSKVVYTRVNVDEQLKLPKRLSGMEWDTTRNARFGNFLQNRNSLLDLETFKQLVEDDPAPVAEEGTPSQGPSGSVKMLAHTPQSAEDESDQHLHMFDLLPQRFSFQEDSDHSASSSAATPREEEDCADDSYEHGSSASAQTFPEGYKPAGPWPSASPSLFMVREKGEGHAMAAASTRLASSPREQNGIRVRSGVQHAADSGKVVCDTCTEMTAFGRCGDCPSCGAQGLREANIFQETALTKEFEALRKVNNFQETALTKEFKALRKVNNFQETALTKACEALRKVNHFQETAVTKEFEALQEVNTFQEKVLAKAFETATKLDAEAELLPEHSAEGLRARQASQRDAARAQPASSAQDRMQSTKGHSVEQTGRASPHSNPRSDKAGTRPSRCGNRHIPCASPEPKDRLEQQGRGSYWHETLESTYLDRKKKYDAFRDVHNKAAFILQVLWKAHRKRRRYLMRVVTLPADSDAVELSPKLCEVDVDDDQNIRLADPPRYATSSNKGLSTRDAQWIEGGSHGQLASSESEFCRENFMATQRRLSLPYMRFVETSVPGSHHAHRPHTKQGAPKENVGAFERNYYTLDAKDPLCRTKVVPGLRGQRKPLVRREMARYMNHSTSVSANEYRESSPTVVVQSSWKSPYSRADTTKLGRPGIFDSTATLKRKALGSQSMSSLQLLQAYWESSEKGESPGSASAPSLAKHGHMRSLSDEMEMPELPPILSDSPQLSKDAAWRRSRRSDKEMPRRHPRYQGLSENVLTPARTKVLPDLV